MAIRTVQFIGQAYSPTGSVNVTFDFNNSRVFQGPVTALTTPQPIQITDRVALFTFELDTSLVGVFPLIIQVSGGTLGFVGLFGNNILVNNPEEFSDLNFNTLNTDGKENVIIDGDLQMRNPDVQSGPGDWCWLIQDNGTLTCDFTIGTPISLPAKT